MLSKPSDYIWGDDDDDDDDKHCTYSTVTCTIVSLPSVPVRTAVVLENYYSCESIVGLLWEIKIIIY